MSVQRKELKNAQSLYNHVRESMAKGQPSLLELTCDQVEEKKIAVLCSEIMAVQIYEKTALVAGTKRPGFSFEDE